MLIIKLFNIKDVIQFPNGDNVKRSDDGKTLTVIDSAGDPAKPGTDAVFDVSKVERIVKK